MTLFFALLVAGAPLASPVGVAASSPSADYPQGTEVISTDDLDLTEPADRKRLDRRIAWAATKICRDLSATGTLLEQSQCSSRAISNVSAQRAALIARAFYTKTRELNGGGIASGFTGLPAADSAEFR
ncbi:UrcA family protein [Sphingobium sp. PNB]|uniref:UrcA family protein n=1 Tax=Sphingobium sp. PNB TaxID=863934 RepID=UPI001CA3CDC4|nr:UrcA family protein [Sphingobium sp. PNB]MCB4858436.1 UrcA family protein [Sphingobium sp. PNB]